MGFGPCGGWTPNLGSSAPTQGRKVGAEAAESIGEVLWSCMCVW